jgi:hypothetical protein
VYIVVLAKKAKMLQKIRKKNLNYCEKALKENESIIKNKRFLSGLNWTLILP